MLSRLTVAWKGRRKTRPSASPASSKRRRGIDDCSASAIFRGVPFVRVEDLVIGDDPRRIIAVIDLRFGIGVPTRMRPPWYGMLVQVDPGVALII